MLTKQQALQVAEASTLTFSEQVFLKLARQGAFESIVEYNKGDIVKRLLVDEYSFYNFVLNSYKIKANKYKKEEYSQKVESIKANFEDENLSFYESIKYANISKFLGYLSNKPNTYKLDKCLKNIVHFKVSDSIFAEIEKSSMAVAAKKEEIVSYYIDKIRSIEESKLSQDQLEIIRWKKEGVSEDTLLELIIKLKSEFRSDPEMQKKKRQLAALRKAHSCQVITGEKVQKNMLKKVVPLYHYRKNDKEVAVNLSPVSLDRTRSLFRFYVECRDEKDFHVVNHLFNFLLTICLEIDRELFMEDALKHLQFNLTTYHLGGYILNCIDNDKNIYEFIQETPLNIAINFYKVLELNNEDFRNYISRTGSSR